MELRRMSEEAPREAPPVEFDLPVHGGFAPMGIGETFPDDAPDAEELEIAGEPGQDPVAAFRRTLGMFATGVTVITTQVGEQVHGMTANAFMSVSLRPPLVVISVDRRAKMHALLNEGSRYGISVLADEQRSLSDRFAGRTADDDQEVEFDVVHETPLVRGALAHLVARVVRSSWGGDHSLFIGQVEYARYGEGQPLLFHGGRYEHLFARAPMLSTLPPEILDTIMAAGEERSYEPDQAVVREGESGEELFVILEGEARIERGGNVLAAFGPGEFFGEIAVLDGRPRSADVVAATPLRCLTISRDVLRVALEREPQAAWAMLQILAGRLRDD
jgi:flavin reductase (DIM6/NTAB) family NADH-FMN oxidoreductase RutF